MYASSFSHLDSSAHERERAQRLMFSALIALSSVSVGLATMLTLDRLDIERVGGVTAELDISQITLMAPPKLIEPPPAPVEPKLRAEASVPSKPSRPTPAAAAATDDDESAPDSEPDEGPTSSIPDPTGIPSNGGGGCPGGICKSGPAVPVGCLGPHCGTGGGGGGGGIGSGDVAPMAVEFSALRCLACPDPSKEALRKTAASRHHERGRVDVYFCVDAKGSVDKRSIKLRKSFGDADVDRIAKDAVGRWRFKAMKVAGKARRACTETSFNIRFE